MHRVVFAFIVLFGAALSGPVLLAQAAQQMMTTAAESATPTGHASEWGSSVMWAFLSSSLLEMLKRRNIWKFSDRMAWGAQRVLGLLLAVATAAGIHWSFDASTGVLTVSGLLWPSIGSAIGESLRQFVFQEVTYRVAVKNYRQGE